MKFIEYVKLSFRELGRRKGRTFLTSIGIAIAAILIVTMVALGSGVNEFLNSLVTDDEGARTLTVSMYRNVSEEEINDAEMNMEGDKVRHPITPVTVQMIESLSSVESVKGKISGQAEFIKYNGKEYRGNIGLQGMNRGASIFTKTEIENVRLTKEDNSLEPLKAGSLDIQNKGEVVISEKIANALNVSPKDIIGKDISLNLFVDGIKEGKEIKYKVTGVMDSNFQEQLYIYMLDEDASDVVSYLHLQKDYLNEVGYDQSITVMAKSKDDVESLASDIREMDYIVTTPQEMSDSVKDIFDSINMAFIILGIIVVVVSAISIINTMSMSVIERTKSIGIMKSLGANSVAIRTMFLVQSSIIGFIGGVIGILVGSGLNVLIQLIGNYIINANGIVTKTISIGLPWYVLVIVLGFAMLISLIAGIIPAIKASKLDPVEALRR